MNIQPAAFALIAFLIGALSDFFLIRNGLSYSGLTLLDKYPLLWLVWLVFILLCAFVLERKRPLPREGSLARYLPGAALSILLGAMVTHAVLLIRDLIGDPTRHGLWPFEFLFWGIVVAVPAFLGWLLARKIFKAHTPSSPS